MRAPDGERDSPGSDERLLGAEVVTRRHLTSFTEIVNDQAHWPVRPWLIVLQALIGKDVNRLFLR